ncbi:MAG: superoxide dismutase family protein [Allosphingosinicella sp.]|uniref:superoxide dismutase family protein n=1 Tax=Allosphingosinicella sp. TaxID=2823234 RepID=UPI00395D654D
MRLRKSFPVAILGGLAVAACVPNGSPGNAGLPGPAEASARILDAAGRQLAAASAVQQNDGLRISVSSSGLRAGTYGLHVHAVGRCDPPDFTSAGGHWNPTMRQHGSQNPQGPHRGDLPNLIVGANGQGEIAFTIPDARLSGGVGGMLDADGAAIVVHAGPDDYRTDPSGNSGARIGCGVFG